MADNMTVKDVAGVAKAFGVDFSKEDTDTLQKWMEEEKSESYEKEEN